MTVVAIHPVGGSSDDFWRDYDDMFSRGIEFVREPKRETYGMVTVFEDLYGNPWDLLELNEDHPIRRRMVEPEQSTPVPNRTVSFTLSAPYFDFVFMARS